MDRQHKVSGNFTQEDWDRLSELLEYFKGESKGNVSKNDALKVCVNTTYETLHVFGKIDIVHIKNEIDELKNENGELKKVIYRLPRQISQLFNTALNECK
jgi:ArsR family metal-binding transcriptional regulator